MLVLTQSDYGVHSTMGWVTAPILILALLFDLFLMPAIFLKVDGGKRIKGVVTKYPFYDSDNKRQEM